MTGLSRVSAELMLVINISLLSPSQSLCDSYIQTMSFLKFLSHMISLDPSLLPHPHHRPTSWPAPPFRRLQLDRPLNRPTARMATMQPHDKVSLPHPLHLPASSFFHDRILSPTSPGTRRELPRPLERNRKHRRYRPNVRDITGIRLTEDHQTSTRKPIGVTYLVRRPHRRPPSHNPITNLSL